MNDIVASFKNANVLIVGDVMLDQYYIGSADRISPEAPVPVVTIKRKENRLGGAANVALNIKSLDANPIICSVIGNDKEGNKMLELFNREGINTKGIIQTEKRITTTKTRIVSRSQQMLRFDEEIVQPVDTELEARLISLVLDILAKKEADVIVFQDYNKGCITPKLIKEVSTAAREKNIPIAVDPKKINFLEYANATLFKPNLKEIKEGLNIEINTEDINSLDTAAKKLRDKLNHKITLITLSEKGIYVHFNDHSEIIPAHMRNIADVSGAGDTVISIAALCLIKNIDPVILAKLSNLGGGLVCESSGVIPINKLKLIKESELL